MTRTSAGEKPETRQAEVTIRISIIFQGGKKRLQLAAIFLLVGEETLLYGGQRWMDNFHRTKRGRICTDVALMSNCDNDTSALCVYKQGSV